MEKQQIEQVVIETLRRGIHFAHREVSPATPLYIALEDRLRILVFNSVAAAEVDVELRLQLPDGQVIPWRGQFFPTNNRASNSFEQDLAEGFLLDVSVSTPTAAVRAGACYVVLQIIRGTGANAIVMRSLLANYVTTGMAVGWPEGPSGSSVQGQGLAYAFTVANPAAGADWVATVPTGARWLVQFVSAALTTSAAVATRVPQIQIKDAGGTIVWENSGDNTVAGVTNAQYSWAGGVPLQGNNNVNQMPIPDFCYLLQGFTIGPLTPGLQAGDQWSAIRVTVVEWIEQ